MSRQKQTILLMTVLASFAFASMVNGQTMMTATADGPNGSHDDWNNAANWTGGIPTGAVNATINDGLFAEAWNDSTPAYTGNLTLGVGSTLQMGWTTSRPNSFNAIGGSVTMNDGSQLRLRLPDPNPVVLPNITLAGNGSIDLSPSTSAHHRARDFDGVIDGTGTLTVIGNNNNTANISAANNGWSGGFIADAIDSWRVQVDAAGAFGTGDVTINGHATNPDRGVTLQLDVLDAIDDSATLFLNDGRDHRRTAKLILNAGEEFVGGFVVDGVELGVGTYDASSGLLTPDGDALIAGPGSITVLPAAAVPEPASIAIWSLIGLGLVGFGVYRRQKK